MTNLASTFPLGLFVNENNTLDINKLKGNVDFLLVKVNGTTDWDKKFAQHVDEAYQLGIPCGLAIYIDPSTVDFNWPLKLYDRWNKEQVLGKYLNLPATKKFNFGVLYYHPSRMVDAAGNAIDPNWLASIPIYMAENLQDAWFTKTKDTAFADRRIVIGCSPTALEKVADPNTNWRDWPFMPVVDGFTNTSTWDTIRADMATVDAPAVSPSNYRPLWNFDPYPSHNLPGTGGAGLVAYLGSKENFLKWCDYSTASTPTTPDAGDDTPTTPDTGDSVSADLTETNTLLLRIAVASEKIAGVLK